MTETTKISSTDLATIEKALGADAKTLLEHKCEKVPSSLLHLPSADFVDRFMAPSDRNPRVMRSMQTLFDSGRLQANLDLAEASLVLFASRRQMREVYDRARLALRDRILLQDHFAKQELLRLHRARVDAGEGSVIFGLASFAEGIDLPGERLIGAFIATLGLPQVNPVNEQMRRRLQAVFGSGHDYTYLYPGIRKVIQAAGRVIRTTDDRGSLHLIDDRFARPRVLGLLPPWWRIDLGADDGPPAR